MACNFLNMKSELRGSNTDTSSLSERITRFSDSREDLRDLVSILGLAGIEDLHEDRFRVDRKKLEHMILGDIEAPEPADTFFHKIMEETNTVITWPSQLKIGAKTKRDPYIRVAGRLEDIRAAKEKLLSHLYTKNNHVTMKMDVSYTGHSHIIGKGGVRIKQVMNETGCHIHFPDSNRTNPTEKSNQVSIAGDISQAEIARERVRNLTPLVFTFELPVMGCSQTPPDVNSPYVTHISQQYNVEVMLRTRPKLHATMVLVKGAEWDVQQVKEATILLIKYMCDNIANQISVQMIMDISPCHHPIVLGEGGVHLKAIMQRTSTQIMFPDANDPNIPSIKKSSVTITGGIHNVYSARQQLMGSLPLVLMFELPENLSNISPERITHLMSTLDVLINVRHKVKQNALGIVIKGIERNATQIYEARYQMLNLTGSRVKANIPYTYNIPNAPTIFGPDYSHNIYQSTNVNSNKFYSPCCSTYRFPGYSSHPNFIFPQQYLSYFSTQQTGIHSCDTSLSGILSSNSSFTCDNAVKDSGYLSVNNSNNFLSPIPSPSKSPNNIMPDVSTNIDLTSMFSNLKIPETSQQSIIPNLDYHQRRLAAVNAMQDNAYGYRIPTNVWSGYGLSATSPGVISSSKKENGCVSTTCEQDDEIWLPSKATELKNEKYEFTSSDFNLPSTSGINMNASNYLDHTPNSSLKQIQFSKWKDLPSLLTSVSLEKYIRHFLSHEIDLTTFTTLTDKDLLEIGVTALGARKKLRLIIAELNNRSSLYSGSAAPGAERNKSSSSSTPNK